MNRLWQRCKDGAATTPMQWRAFAIAEDVLAFGHLCLVTFAVALSPPELASNLSNLRVRQWVWGCLTMGTAKAWLLQTLCGYREICHCFSSS